MTTALVRPLQGLAAARTPRSRIPAIGISAAAIVYLAIFATLVHNESAPRYTRDVLNLFPAVIALVLAVYRYIHSRNWDRVGWLLLALGVLTWLAGDLMSTYYTFVLDRSIPFPSVAEPLYYMGYALLPLGFLLLSGASFERLESHAYIDLAMLALAMTVLTWEVLLAPVAAQDLSIGPLLAAIAYPAFDIAVLLLLAFVFYHARERNSARFGLFACTIGVSIAADSFYATDVDSSGSYAAAIDTLFAAAYWLLALAFVIPAPESNKSANLPGQRSLAGVYLPRILTVVVIAWGMLVSPAATERLEVMHVGALIGLALLIVRQLLTTRDNGILLARQERANAERAILLRALGDLGEAFATIKDGRFVTSNHALWYLLGYRDDELRGTTIESHLVERDRPRLRGIMQRAEENDTVIAGAEVTVLHRDGREVMLEVTVKPVITEAGRQLLLVARDITERKMTQRAVLESQKLEGLRVLAGGVAHDFNNLLQVIRGYAHLATLELGDDERIKPYLLDIELASERAAGLARQMLIYAGKADPLSETIEPGKVVQEMALLLRASVGESVQIDVVTEPGIPPVVGDASQLRQVVMNLVVNASEAIGDKGGHIDVRTAYRYLSARDLADAHAAIDVPEGNFICIEVRDDGPGMPDDVRRRIFDPFYSTKFAGRGLGLAAVFGIIRAHGGAITVQSTPGNGATFSICLPAHEPGSSEVAS